MYTAHVYIYVQFEIIIYVNTHRTDKSLNGFDGLSLDTITNYLHNRIKMQRYVTQ